MSLNIRFSDLWTYNVKIPANRREPSDKKTDICFLDEKEFTHIHGDLTIEINGSIVPKMSYDSSSDVCFGYWIEELVRLFKTFDEGHNEYTIHGMDQGMPGYLFNKKGQTVYLSVVKSLNGGRTEPDWQLVEINYKDLKKEFLKLKNTLLKEIGLKAPNMLKTWSEKFA